jgi:hypothetical protein
MKGRKQKILEDKCPQEGRAELKSNVGVQTFIWINETRNTERESAIICHFIKLKNYYMLNDTYGGVRGRNGN